VAFEILGMLGRPLRIMGSSFTYLPNPTIFPWDNRSLSLRRMLNAFCSNLLGNILALESMGHENLTDLSSIFALSGSLNADLPSQEGDFQPKHLDDIHNAIITTDNILCEDKIPPDKVQDVLRCHLQEVLHAMNAPTVFPNGLVDGLVSFDDLWTQPPECHEHQLMDKYFKEILERVMGIDSANAFPLHDSSVATGSPTPRRQRNQHEVERNTIWCTLVLRMICWLLLHNFDGADVQIPKSELMGSQLPVYIV
jgi:hypothetical protein